MMNDLKDNLVNLLNTAVGTWQMIYDNIKGYHWNMRGGDFYPMHVQFDEFADFARNNVDVFAEYIRQIGELAPHTMEEFNNLSNVEPADLIPENIADMGRALLADFEQAEALHYRIMAAADRFEPSRESMARPLTEEITLTLIKYIWMIKAWTR